MKQLAINYLNTRDQLHVAEARELLKNYKFESIAKLKRFLGITYLAGVNSSQKISKGTKLNYLTLVLYLSASRNAGIDVCKFATTGCRLACLVGSGHALIEERAGRNTIAASRVVKTWLVMFRRDLANLLLQSEIDSAKRRAERTGQGFAVRLNGTSDLDFSDIIEANPEVQFYDYTKDPTRKLWWPNYNVTFSYSSFLRMDHYRQALLMGASLAIPTYEFEDALKIPGTFSMDETDLRFLDRGKFGLLKAKKTTNLSRGIENRFILSASEVRQLVEALA
jgi:hypothetical protein